MPPSSAARPAFRRRWPLLFTAVLCTVVLSIGVMRTSMERGRLAFYPRLDDVMYLARGAEMVRAGKDGWANGGVLGSVRGVARDWKRDPPHAPWASGSAAIGFGLFGYRDWAAYLPTALPVLAFLFCVTRLVWRAGGRWQWRSHVLVIFAATAPFLAASIYNLKPDYAAGICAAIGIMNALRGPIAGASFRRLAWIGMLFGLSLLAKPAMMVPTAMLAMGALAICTVRDLLVCSRDRWGVRLKRAPAAWLVVLGAMALLAAPHYVFALRAEWAYTRGTLTGEGADMWGYRGTWGQHASYYLTGPGGRLMLDGLRSLAPLGGVIAAYACVAVLARVGTASGGYGRRRRGYLLAALAAIAMAWIGPTLATVKIAQFASCFSALVWLAGVHAAVGIIAAARATTGASTRRHGWLRLPIIASLLVLALLTARIVLYRWTFPTWPADRNNPVRASRDAREALVRRAYEDVRREAALGARSVLVAGGQRDLAWELLTLWSVRDGVPLHAQQVQRKPDAGEAAAMEQQGRAWFDSADVLLVSQGIARIDRPKVIHADADEFYLRLARTDDRFERVARTDDPASGAMFEVYRRRTTRPGPR